MGNSTKSVASIFDVIAARGIPDPRLGASGYGTTLALDIASRVMSDIIKERFNWKWNRAIAVPFYTNSWQQDYPQLGNANMDWLEDCDRIDINNTSVPKPIVQMTARRQLSRCSVGYAPIVEICWMYNNLLSYGTWPGAGVVFSPLVTAGVLKQNPIMNMVDINGNLLIVTGFGTTGSVAPAAPANSAEGFPVTDGTVTWKVVSASSKGFRIFGLPSATGPVYQITPYYQKEAPNFTTLQQMIDPIPDNYAGYFQTGCELYSLDCSTNPQDRAKFKDKYPEWIKSMDDCKKQGDREPDAYGMIPASSPVESTYGYRRNPQDPNQPY